MMISSDDARLIAYCLRLAAQEGFPRLRNQGATEFGQSKSEVAVKAKTLYEKLLLEHGVPRWSQMRGVCITVWERIDNVRLVQDGGCTDWVCIGSRRVPGVFHDLEQAKAEVDKYLPLSWDDIIPYREDIAGKAGSLLLTRTR